MSRAQETAPSRRKENTADGLGDLWFLIRLRKSLDKPALAAGTIELVKGERNGRSGALTV